MTDSAVTLANTVRQSEVDSFLEGRRLAVVGASDDPKNFARTVYVELKSHGYDVVAVHPSEAFVDHDPCFADLASVPGDIDGVIVMVSSAASADVVLDCVARGVRRVWLFRGLGGPGAVSDEALRLCREHSLNVVAGACPLMFLEPVGWFHRMHRAARRGRGALLATA